MLQWEYVRIMNRNYIQTKVWERPENTFQYRMLLSAPIKGLLKCKERELNGEKYFVFDISSMQNLASIYAEKKMDFSSFYQLIYSIKCVVRNMRLYLLEAENLIFYPELIFQELDSGEINFVCSPIEDEFEGNSIKKLYQFLLSAIDYEDTELTELIYEAYEEIEENMSLLWLENVYERLGKLQNERLQKKKNIFEESEDSIIQSQDELLCEEFQGQTQNSQLDFCKKAALICGVYVAIVGVVIYWIYSNYILSIQENIITIGAIVVATAIMAFWLFMRLKRKENDSVDEKEDVLEHSPISIESEEKICEENEYGRTIFFEADSVENKLYGIGKNNRRKIEINKFPFIVGKKSGVVDEIIDDASVSRMHARFEKEGETVYIEDLNSTNGTYKNGIMLAPHQKIEVFSEDEIWFGRLQFIYR